MKDKYISECVQTQIQKSRANSPSGVLGVIASYDRYENTATVIVSASDTDAVEEILYKVPCPVLLGIQSVAPDPGRPCYVVFKGGNRSQALITHFYNHNYSEYDYGRQTQADIAIPSYLLNI